MDPLDAARWQMGISLGFHIIFSALGIGLPLFMLIAEGLWLRTRKPEYLSLARTWSKATGLLFAVGAVSGTALSFELGLLWPRFMAFSGSLIGAAFALEGYAFFVEAIFIGLYLYGWDRVPERIHWLCGIPVAVSGVASGILVVSANAWMQQPVGFQLVGGQAVNVDPIHALFNPAWAVMAVHATIACYVATAFGVGSVYAWGWLRGHRDERQRLALRMALAVAVVVAVLQPISGDFNARFLTTGQPTKLAAMEALFKTTASAPLTVGGIVDEATMTVRYGIEIPYGLSLLVWHDPHREVTGLEAFPRSEWPNVAVVHTAFDIMVGIGTALAGLALLYWLVSWRRRGRIPDLLIRVLVVAGPLAFLALEAGWIVSEEGRQPYTIHGVMRTADAVTPAHGVPETFVAFMLLYLLLAVVLSFLLVRLGTGAESGAH
jgi:cytochrome d ubiquinol oxidase subunit I